MRLHGTETIGRMTFQWTQHICDGCEVAHPDTTHGHDRGISNPPDGWKRIVIKGTIRTFCPRCQNGAARTLLLEH